MAARRHLEKGITLFGNLSTLDKKWVISSLRTSVGSGRGTEELGSFLEGRRPGAKRPFVFLSHSHADKPFVRRLAAQLEHHGIDTWLDEAELRIADSLVERLMGAIDQVDFVLVVMSPASMKSRWVREELKAALFHQIRRRRIVVLPVLKGRCVVPAFLRDQVYADFTTPYRRRKNFPSLVESIISHHRQKKGRRARAG